MLYKLNTQAGRVKLVDFINSQPNKDRKKKSLREFEIYSKRQKQFVIEQLKESYTPETVKEMPVIHSINLCTKIVKEQASLYNDEPTRTFMGVSDQVAGKLKDLYEDINLNTKLKTMNRYFKLQDQAHINFTIRDRKIKPRVLLAHHLDVIPQDDDPEAGAIYVISNFDKNEYLTDNEPTATGYKGKTKTRAEDLRLRAELRDRAKQRYVVWSKEYNFIMDGNGVVISKKMNNPIAPLVPFVEATVEKDYEYWVRNGSDTAEFSIQFNAMFSDLQNVVKMQGWGQAVFIGPEGVIPEHFVIGMNSVIRLPVDPSSTVAPDFKYVSPTPDLVGSLQILTTALSTFLSSNDIDPGSVVTDGSAQSFASALDRLLAKMSEFEASKEDMTAFKVVETGCFEIIKAFVNTWGGTAILDLDMADIPEASKMSISFAEPQSVMTEKEQLELIEKKRSMGLMSRKQAYMEFNDVDAETAEKALAEIDEEKRKERDVTNTQPALPAPNLNKEPAVKEEDSEKEPDEGDDDGGDSGADAQ